MERPHEPIELIPHTVTTRSENEDLPSPSKDKSSNFKKKDLFFSSKEILCICFY